MFTSGYSPDLPNPVPTAYPVACLTLPTTALPLQGEPLQSQFSLHHIELILKVDFRYSIPIHTQAVECAKAL